MPTYRTISSSAVFLYVALTLALLFRPDLIFVLFGLEEHASTVIVARRAAMLFLGLATMAWLSRDAEKSRARIALSRGMATALFTLAFLGTAEFASGNVGGGVFVAVVGELVFAIGYLLAEKR